ncbi:hypothetical protein C0J52_00085 [Blattella germanica]|nr:hypothetical protein C0J52_00085 [Blattella germanica]
MWLADGLEMKYERNTRILVSGRHCVKHTASKTWLFLAGAPVSIPDNFLLQRWSTYQNRLSEVTKLRSFNNALEGHDYDLEHGVRMFINRGSSRVDLHLGNAIFGIHPHQTVLRNNLAGDILTSAKNDLELATNKYGILFLTGNLDLLVPAAKTEEFLNDFYYSGRPVYFEEVNQQWMFHGVVHGYKKSARNLTSIVLINCGHLIFADCGYQGREARRLVGFSSGELLRVHPDLDNSDQATLLLVFPCEKEPNVRPVLLWLMSGPGETVMSAIMEENEDATAVRYNGETWTKDFNIPFVDNPVGSVVDARVGLHFGDDELPQLVERPGRIPERSDIRRELYVGDAFYANESTRMSSNICLRSSSSAKRQTLGRCSTITGCSSWEETWT